MKANQSQSNPNKGWNNRKRKKLKKYLWMIVIFNCTNKLNKYIKQQVKTVCTVREKTIPEFVCNGQLCEKNEKGAIFLPVAFIRHCVVWQRHRLFQHTILNVSGKLIYVDGESSAICAVSVHCLDIILENEIWDDHSSKILFLFTFGVRMPINRNIMTNVVTANIDRVQILYYKENVWHRHVHVCKMLIITWCQKVRI